MQSRSICGSVAVFGNIISRTCTQIKKHRDESGEAKGLSSVLMHDRPKHGVV